MEIVCLFFIHFNIKVSYVLHSKAIERVETEGGFLSFNGFAVFGIFLIYKKLPCK